MHTKKILLLALLAIGCGGEPEAKPVPAGSSPALSGGGSPAEVLPLSANAHGISQIELSENFQRYIYSIPASQNPLLNDVIDCSVGQTGRVFNVPLRPFSRDVIERTCTVPRGQYVFFTFSGFLNDFPCPDPTDVPAPGQTLEAFLRQGAIAGNASVDAIFSNIELTVDGVVVPLDQHRITTPLFTFTGDLSLSTPSFDECVTGKPQQGVFDGWQILIAPPAPGTHVISLRLVSSNRVFDTATIIVPKSEDDR